MDIAAPRRGGRAELGGLRREPRDWAAARGMMLCLPGRSAWARAGGQQHRSSAPSSLRVLEAGRHRRGQGPTAGCRLVRLIFPGDLSGPGERRACRASHAAQL